MLLLLAASFCSFFAGVVVADGNERDTATMRQAGRGARDGGYAGGAAAGAAPDGGGGGHPPRLELGDEARYFEYDGEGNLKSVNPVCSSHCVRGPPPFPIHVPDAVALETFFHRFMACCTFIFFHPEMWANHKDLQHLVSKEGTRVKRGRREIL